MAGREQRLEPTWLVLGLLSAAVSQAGPAAKANDFNAFDANGDGVIDKDEFANVADVLGGSSGAAPARGLNDGAPELAPGVEVGADGAYVDCPCVDHVNDPAWAAVFSPHIVQNQGKTELAILGTTVRRDYGSARCAVWDAIDSIGTCTDGVSHRSCKAAWCYVNGSQCHRKDATISSAVEGVAWSYFTCGDVGFFSNDTNVSALSPVYAGDLTNRGAPTRAVPAPPPDMPSNRRVSVMFAYAVAGRLGLEPGILQYRALSDASLRNYASSSYTACVHDINIGNLDLCLGDWWFTSARSLMAVEFIPVFVEDMMLLVPRVDHEEHLTVWDHVSRTFAPFSWGLWGVILGTLCVAALVMAVVEGDGRCSRGGRCNPAVITTPFHQMALSFASFSTMLDPATPAGKVLGLGTAFFLTFVGACFTANTAQFLLVEARKAKQVDDLQGFLDEGGKVCFQAPMLPILLEIDGRVAHLGVAVDGDPLERLLGGDCGGAIASQYRVRDYWADQRACEYELVGAALHSYLVGFYASAELGASVRHAVSVAMADGTWASVSGGLAAKSSTCAPTETAASKTPRQLHSGHMLGNNLVLGACCLVALVMHFLGKAEKKIEDSLRLGESTPQGDQDQEGGEPVRSV